MNKLCVGAYGNDLCAGVPELILLLCQSSELGSSDKGKIGGIKEEDRPSLFRLERFEAHLAEIALRRLISLELEVGHILTDPKSATVLTHN